MKFYIYPMSSQLLSVLKQYFFTLAALYEKIRPRNTSSIPVGKQSSSPGLPGPELNHLFLKGYGLPVCTFVVNNSARSCLFNAQERMNKVWMPLMTSVCLFVFLLLTGCSFVHAPEKVSDVHQPRRNNIYNQSKSLSSQAENAEMAVDEYPTGTEPDHDQVISLPRPLGVSENEADSFSSSDYSDRIFASGTLPGEQLFANLMPSKNMASAPILNELEGNEVVHLDYEQVELREILEEISDTLGMDLVIDSSIQGKVTMRTSSLRPLHKKDLWSVLQLLLSEAGVTLSKKGKVYHATMKEIVLPSQIGMLNYGDYDTDSNEKILQFIALKNVSQETVVPVLSSLVEPHGKILAMPTLNVIGVIAQPYIQDRIFSLLPLLDADPFKYRGIRLFRLQESSSKEVAVELSKILSMIEGEKSTFRVLDLERINSVLVVSPPDRNFRQVEHWVHILDNGFKDDVEQVFVYHVKNLQAVKFAATLSDIFSDDTEERRKELRATVNEEVGQSDTTSRFKKTLTTDKRTLTKGEQQDNVVREQPKDAVQNRTMVAVSQSGINADIRLKIVADEDTNSLLIRSTARDYKQLLKTISLMDTPPLEVMCNIVIAEVLLNEENQFGIDWYLLSRYGDALLGTPFDITNGYQIPGAENRNILTTNSELTGSFTEQGLTLERVGGGRLGQVLTAVASVGNIKVLSRPSILVRNNQEALIKVGTEEPILTSVSNSDIISGGQTAIQNDVQYRDTGIILTVKPHITKDGIINMSISQEISKLGDNRTIYDLPSFDSSKIETSVVVQDGTAIILGGVIRTQKRAERDGLPFLSDLPFLGALFSTTKNTEYRYELVLIIVPEIIDPQVNNDRLVESFLYQMGKVSELIDEQIGVKNFRKP